jgi:hypothetical protein
MKSLVIFLHKSGKHVWILVLIIFFILLPIALVAFDSNFYNPLVQVLIDFALFGASLWFGVSVSNKEAEKRATDKWLVAAVNACNELATMRESAKEMGFKQGSVCELIEEIVPGIPQTKLEPVKKLMGLNCNGCATHMADLQNRIENIRQSYSVFVNANCDETECARFHEIFDRREQEIQDTYKNVKATFS